MSNYHFTVTVAPRHLSDQSAPEQGLFAFAYTVTIVNTGQVTAQLIARHWVIEDAAGHSQEVKGLGVVGQQPLLKPGQAFEYTSGAQLRTATGSMRGFYFCVAEDGERFEVNIPLFVLDASDDGTQARVLH